MVKSKKRLVGTNVEKEFYLLVEFDEDFETHDDRFSRLVTVMKYPTVSKVFAQIGHLFFKDRYYSTKRNFRTIVTKLDISSAEYNEAINKLVDGGIFEEEKERVYKLTEGLHILSSDEYEWDDNGDKD